LLDGAMLLLDLPTPGHAASQGSAVKSGERVVIGQEGSIMARLVFQPCPE
jgi:hypothetical protein